MAVNPSSIFAPGALPLPPDFRVEAGYEDNAGEYEPHGADAAASSGLEGATLVSPPETRVVPAAAGAQQPFALGSSVGVALAAYGLSAPLRFALLRAFECGEEDSADALGETPEAEVEEVLNEMMLDDEARPPTRIEKCYVRGFFRKLRSNIAAALVPVQPTAPTTGPITLTMPDTSNRLEYRDVLDQTARGTYTMLPPADIMALRRRYDTHTGAPVEGDARPSDRQLSALTHWLRPQADGRREAPFVEFAIWGPYDGRSAKTRQFHEHVLTRDGTWQFRLLRGPTTFSQWEASWRVFAACLIMLDVAKLGQLQQYFAGIRRLHELYPNDWATVSLLDEEMRSELWPRLYEEITQGVKPEPKNFNRDSPWGSIIAESRYDYLQGPLADHWRRKEIMLERAAKVKPSNRNLGEAPGTTAAPPPPSHQIALGTVVPSWGSGGQPQPKQPGQGRRAKARAAVAKAKAAASNNGWNNGWNNKGRGKGKGKNKRKGNELPTNFTGCHYCKGPHFLKDCPKWVAAGRPPIEGVPPPKKAAK